MKVEKKFKISNRSHFPLERNETVAAFLNVNIIDLGQITYLP